MRHAGSVLLLSRVTGQKVTTPDGRLVGRLADLTVRLDDPEPLLVEHLVVKRPGGLLVVPWHAVANLHAGRVVLATQDVDHFAVGSLSESLSPDEILLARDVLDTQIVDVVGQRMARVADIVLARTAGSGLELLGVEVGFGAVLRRLGLGAWVPRTAGDMVAWSDLHLTSERGHAVQLSTPRAAVHRLDARGLAALMSRVDTDSAAEILVAREPVVAAEAIRVAHPSVAERLLRALPASYATRIVGAMPSEHAGRWRNRLRQHRPRRFLRSHVWPRRRSEAG